MPPCAATAAEYGLAAVAPAREPVVTASGAAVTARVRLAEALRGVGTVESVTATVNAEVVAEVGVPEITPVVASRVTPLGRCPDVMAQR